MGAIGGLDVPYGAATQIVRTNVMVVEVTTNNITEQAGRNVLDRAQQGLPELLAPDLIYFTDDNDADIEDVGWSTAADWHVDTTGNDTVDSTRLETNGCVRDIRQVPLASGSTGTVTGTAALGTAVADPVPGNLQLQAVLSCAAVELTTMDNATPAATIIAPLSGTVAGGAGDPTNDPLVITDGPNSGVSQAVNSDNLYARALEVSFEADQTSANMALAGHPAGAVSYLDLSGVAELMASGFAGTGADFTAGDLLTLATQAGEPGRLQSTDTNLAWDDIDDELANNCGIISVVSLCKVA